MKFLAAIGRFLSKLLFIGLILAPAFVLQFAAQNPTVQTFTLAIQNHLPLYLIALLSVKALSVVYPLLPGSAFTLASLPLIGWQLAYVIDLIGSAIGVTLAFYLGKKYGVAILNRVLGQTLTTKVLAIKLKPSNQFEAALFLRLAVGSTLSDGLAWGAGLIGFRYVPFIMGYLIAHILITLPIFYFIAAAVSINSWLILATIMAISWLIIYTFKGRYFE